MSPPVNSIHENRLAQETSPYLLQHKNNPVEWWPWGPDALAEAKRRGKPILLSVGYAACHWCHVMAHESFEDDTTAHVMNELFVNIKVDREERPDIDQIYMAALHHLGEQGGWPLTMFLTSDGEPVWGGTYFPKQSRFGKPAFVDVLRELARMFEEEPQRIHQNRRALMDRLSEQARSAGKIVIGRAELDNIGTRVLGLMDPVYGGIRGAPKFPQGSIFELLWRAGQRTGEGRYFAAVDHTLNRICQGGIYDHLGGGFSRYSVDEHWLVPHFEKMLYDNAQLLELLALAWQRSAEPLYHQRATETVAWLRREMTTREGAFCASLDADSEGEEGKFYVWTYDEVLHHLGPADGRFFAQHYDVTPAGNFEGQTILNLLKAPAISEAERERLASMRARLLRVRGSRVRPALDDKVLADWNGMMIAALTNAATAFEEPEWIPLARNAFDFIVQAMTRDGRLGHSWRADRLLFPGLASDFVFMIKAALALAEATGESGFIEQAVTWQKALDRHHLNHATSGYFLTADDAQGLVLRPASTMDDATPNPNAIAAGNLLRLAVLAGDDAYREKADALLEGILAGAADNLFGHAALLNAVDSRLRNAEVVIAGSGNQANRLHEAALRTPFNDRVVLRAPSARTLPHRHPACDKIVAATEGMAFICVGETCSLPVTDPEKLPAALASMRG